MLIKNVKIVNFDQTIANANITVENGLIKTITPQRGVASKILIPGFIDLHIHGFNNHDVMDSLAALNSLRLQLVKGGTTTFLPTVMTAAPAKLHAALAQIATSYARKSRGAKIAGIHMEGPFFGPQKKGAQNPDYLQDGTIKAIQAFQTSADGLLKKMALDPDVCTPEVVKYLVAQKIIVALGHTNTTFQKAQQFYQLGATSCTHLWNGMSGVANRDPGLAQAVLYNDNVDAELICDLIHVDAATIKFTIKTKGVAKITAITDAIRPAGMPDGTYFSGGQKVSKKGLQIRLKASGTIAGSGATMLANFQNLVALGYRLNDVVAMTSYNASKTLKIPEIGYIKVGNQADLIILNKTYQIEQVYVAGVKGIENETD